MRLWKEGGGYEDHKVHILVLEAFVGPRPDGMVGRHRNDDTTNNALTNLCWGTRVENVQDAVRNGRNKHYKLTPQQRAEILRRRLAGEPCKALAEEFGVNRHHISAIGIGRIKVGELS